MSSTTTRLMWGAVPPLVVLLNARWRQASELCSPHSGHCGLLCLLAPLPRKKWHEIQLHEGWGSCEVPAVVTRAMKIEKPNLVPCLFICRESRSAGMARRGLLQYYIYHVRFQFHLFFIRFLINHVVDRLKRWYMSLPSQALGIIRIGQGLFGSVSR